LPGVQRQGLEPVLLHLLVGHVRHLLLPSNAVSNLRGTA
jgi:hypothetical protein